MKELNIIVVPADPYAMYISNIHPVTHVPTTFVQWDFENYVDNWQRIELSHKSLDEKAQILATYLDQGKFPIGYWNYGSKMHFVVFLSHNYSGTTSISDLDKILSPDDFDVKSLSESFNEDIVPLSDTELQSIARASIPDGKYDSTFYIHDPKYLSANQGGPNILFKYNIHRATLDRLLSIRILID